MATVTYIGPDLAVECRPLRREMVRDVPVEGVDDELVAGLSWAHYAINGQPWTEPDFEPDPVATAPLTDPTEVTE